MQNTWILFLILLFHVGPGLAQSELGPYVGFITKDNRYSISMLDFGIEQFEGGKRTTHRLQLWDIGCQYPPYPGVGQPNETYCSVERTVFDRLGEGTELRTSIGQFLHSTVDENLKLSYVDWEKGELDFQLILVDRNTIEVKLRVQYQDDSIYLKDFQAMEIARGLFSDTMAAIEYRIPEYSYKLDVPVHMRGLKSEDDHKLEDLLQSLSQDDRMIWERIQKAGELSKVLDTVELEPKLRELFPDYDEIKAGIRDLSSEEERKLEVLFFEEAKTFFGKQGFSKDGLQKVLDFMKTAIVTPVK
ncbi:MAG: hypothetical protein ACE5KG_03100 [Nitrososphaerales archaeon]